MNSPLDDKVELLLEGLPGLLKDKALAYYSFLTSKRPKISSVEIYTQMESYADLLSAAFMNPRKYLGMYNRHFVELLIIEEIEKLLNKDDNFSEKDFYTIVRINLDLNGLKALNDLGGQDAGNRGLRIFTDILKDGETTRYIKNLGFNVVSSAESAEEFGIFIYGGGDLRDHIQDIVARYFKELWSTDVHWLINFAHPLVREKLVSLGLEKDVPPDFKFHLSANIGVVFLGEALAQVPIENLHDGYDVLVRKIVAKIFAVADIRAHAHKSAFKDELGKKNPALSALYARLSNEVLHLEKEINRRDERIKELESKLEAGEPER